MSRLLVMLFGAALLGAAALPCAAAMSIERVTGASGVEAWLVEDHAIPIVTLSFAFPDPAQVDDKKAIPFDKDQPFKNLGLRVAEHARGRAAGAAS